MASSPSDLTLDYKPNGNGNGGGAYAVIPKQQQQQQEPLVDGHHLTTEQTTQKLREFLARLEEERLKIDAFKRELPLCMHLLNHGACVTFMLIIGRHIHECMAVAMS
jgi:hypothetical protein